MKNMLGKQQHFFRKVSEEHGIGSESSAFPAENPANHAQGAVEKGSTKISVAV